MLDELRMRLVSLKINAENRKMCKYEELENLSHAEREVWLAEQCTSFEQETRYFLNEKETFVEELHKKLRKITRRWASWNHRSFGPVSSREQVKELLIWERQNQPKFASTSSSDTTDIDVLEKFESYCKKSSKLLHTFRQDIYRPLCEFFCDDEADTVIKEIPRILEKCVQRWEALLQFSPVNERLFSKESERTLNNGVRNRFPDYDSVLRLVPDLYEKKIEALRLAHKWKLLVKSKDIQRRGTYTLSPKTLLKREEMIRVRALGVSQNCFVSPKSYDEINIELREMQVKYNETASQLTENKSRCKQVENEMESYKKQCEKLKDDLLQTMEIRKVLQGKVNESQSSHVTSITCDLTDNTRDTTRLWQRELENVKQRYSTQKIKFLNARKQVELLNKQLEVTHNKCIQLERNIETTSYQCTQLTEQLETAKKKIQTQANMVDALQHQCYVLKQDLDQSNIKKGEICHQLSSTLERCKTVEGNLQQARKKVQELESENGRGKSREEQLERENTKLRHFIESQSTRRRSKEGQLERENIQLKSLLSIKPSPPQSPGKKQECIFPDINGGRSF